MGTHPIFESDFDCLTDMLLLRVFGIFTLTTGSFLRKRSDSASLYNLEIPQGDGNKVKVKDLLDMVDELTTQNDELVDEFLNPDSLMFYERKNVIFNVKNKKKYSKSLQT